MTIEHVIITQSFFSLSEFLFLCFLGTEEARLIMAVYHVKAVTRLLRIPCQSLKI